MASVDAILIIEDDPIAASFLQGSLETEGHAVIVAPTGQEGLRALRSTPVFLVLLDLRLPDMPGVEVMREIQRLDSPPEIVIVTAFASLDSAVAAIEAGAAGYLRKPVDVPRLRSLVAKLREQRQMRRENLALTQRVARERRTLEALYEVSRHWASVHDTEQTLTLIVQETAQLLGTEAVALRLREGDDFVLRAHTESAAALSARSRVKASESVSGLILAAGAPVAIEDLAEDTRFDPAHTQGVAGQGFHGFLGVPLRTGGAIIGALNVYTTARRSFSSEEIALLSALADQASVAIEAARLHDETARRAQQLATLTELTRALTTVLDPPALAREILTAVQVLIPGAAGRLWELTDTGDALHLVASLGLREPEGGVRTRFALGEGLIGIAALMLEPVISADVTQDPRFPEPAWAAAEGLVACIVLPLLRGESVTGGLTIFTRTPHAFTEEEMGLLRSFADQAGIALANARLFQREQARRRQLEAVRAVTGEITRMLDLTELLRLISQRSAELLGAASGAVTLWDEAAQVLVPAAWHGHGEWFRDVRWKLGEGVTGTVAQRRHGLMVNDYRTSPFAHTLMVTKTPITAVLAEPLVCRNRLLGVLTVDSHDGQHTFTESDRQLLALFTAQAAVAIENAQLLAEVKTQRARLAQLFESASDAILVADSHGIIVSWNKAAHQMFGYTEEEVLGKPLTLLMPESLREAHQSGLDRMRSGGEPHVIGKTVELSALRKGGSEFPIELSLAALKTPEGTYYSGIIRNIALRKQAEQMKSDFVSFVTHQLRTPLAGIKWLLELAGQEPDLPQEVGSYIQDARESNERLIRLVNDLLDVSRLERGKLTLEPQALALEALTQSVLEELNPLLAEKGHRLTVAGGADVPPVWADPQLLRQVILNLTSNAIKYTLPGGAISIGMSREEGVARWAIRDSGIGIPPDALHRLFEKFYRAKNALTVETEGTGLGLYLVRLILEQCGGRVWCESEEGKGSTFLFTLPLRESDA